MDKVELLVFNVGHGLSVALVERPSRYVTLIDLGADTGFTPLKHLSLKFKLTPDVVYIAHPHADHLDDVEAALNKDFRPLGIFYQNYDWEDVKKREKKELAYKVDKFRELVAVIPKKTYGGNAYLNHWYFSPEDAKQHFGEASYVNNSSLFLVYKWRDFKVAIAGDLESDAMNGLLSDKRVVNDFKETDILIPPHHGHKNGFPSGWVEKIGKPHISIVSVQERDRNVDSRYSKPDFAKGVNIDGTMRYMLTTRDTGNILVSMWYGNDGRPKWEFQSF